MKKPKIRISFNWLSKIRVLLSKNVGGQSGAQTPESTLNTRLRLQWAGACAAVALCLNIGMYFGLGWTYPSEDEMNFREEVSTLLGIQSYLMKKDNKLIPTMDSIRDVVFGPKTYGRGIREISKEMLRDREKTEVDAELITILEGSMRQWEEAEKELRRDRIMFVAGFATLSIGLPTLLFLLGLPSYRKVAGRIAKRAADKRAAGEKRRQMMAAMAKQNLNRVRGAAVASSAVDDKSAT